MFSINWETLKELGNKYFREKKYEEALNYYNKALDLNDNIEVLHSNKGTCLKCLQNFKAAEMEYIKAIQINPNNAKTFNRLASIYLITGDLAEAYNIQQKALKLDNNTSSYKEQLETIFILMKEEERIKKLFQENNLDDIEKKYQDLNSKYPEVLYLKKKYVLFLFDIIKYKEAMQFMHDQIVNNKISKDNGEFVYLSCLTLYYNEEYETVENLIVNKIKNVESKLYKDLLFRIRNIEKIKKEGNNLYDQKKYEEAIKVYSQALQLDPDHKKYNSIILINRSLSYQKLEKYNDAINDANLSIKINPKYARAYTKRANIYLLLKNYKAAINDFEKAKKLDPSSPGFENYLQDLSKKCSEYENELNLERSRKQKLYKEIISLKNMINIKNNEINDKNDAINDLKAQIKEMQNLLANSSQNSKVTDLMEKLLAKEDALKKMEYEYKEMKSRYPFEVFSDEKLMTVNIVCVTPNITHSIICKNTHKFIYLESILYEKYPELSESENFFVSKGIKINKYKTLEENNIKDNDIINLQKFEKEDEENEKEDYSFKKFISKDSILSKDSFISKDSFGSKINFDNFFGKESKDSDSNSKNDKDSMNKSINNIDF
jgi:DnaJ family protein C protein 7